MQVCEMCAATLPKKQMVKQLRGPSVFWYCCVEHQLAYWNIRFTSAELYHYIRAHPKERTLEMVGTTVEAERIIKVLSKGNEMQRLVKQIGQNSDQWITLESQDGDGLPRNHWFDPESIRRKSASDARTRRLWHNAEQRRQASRTKPKPAAKVRRANSVSGT